MLCEQPNGTITESEGGFPRREISKKSGYRWH